MLIAESKSIAVTDRISPEKRSANMAAIKGKDTGPELAVRKVIHAAGFRFRLHKKDLPGCPDMVLARYRTVVFVHGCFWHHHQGCADATMPKSNTDYWNRKLSRNVERDVKNKKALEALGWNVFVVWECSIRKGSQWEDDFQRFIEVVKQSPPQKTVHKAKQLPHDY
jgi:DNA mismatch endonuclease, patch repair protein